MKEDQDITEKQLWTIKQLLFIVGFAISVTFTLTMIYAEFRLMQNEIIINEERDTKRYNRNQNEIKNIKKDIEELKDNHLNK